MKQGSAMSAHAAADYAQNYAEKIGECSLLLKKYGYSPGRLITIFSSMQQGNPQYFTAVIYDTVPPASTREIMTLIRRL
jgi:hypothetical protein